MRSWFAVQLLNTVFADDPALDAALAAALVRRAAADPGAEPVLRVYSPAPTLAFGRLDTLNPGFVRAAAAARSHGYAPVVRAPGGHAAAYHPGTLVLELVAPDPDAMTGLRARFEAAATGLAAALCELGADARVGPVPGEYCPGEWTVNGAGRVKLAGIAQRQVAGAWLVGAELVVRDAAPARAVLTDVLAALDMPFDPATAAAVEDLLPGVTLDAVRAAILPAWAGLPAVNPDPGSTSGDESGFTAQEEAALIAVARGLRARHAVS